MGTLTESYANLTEFLKTEHQKNRGFSRSPFGSDMLISKVLRPALPASIRCGPGTVTDLKDRQVGPFDVVGCLDRYPVVGDGAAASYLADGVLFCLNAREWAQSDLTQFGELAAQLKTIESKKRTSIASLAIAYDALSLEEVLQFLKSPAGQSVDGILALGQHGVIRNTQGWYGNPEHVPFVTERSGPEALKAFIFFILQITHTALGVPFEVADYQHL
jgi:hypothetical protein